MSMMKKLAMGSLGVAAMVAAGSASADVYKNTVMQTTATGTFEGPLTMVYSGLPSITCPVTLNGVVTDGTNVSIDVVSGSIGSGFLCTIPSLDFTNAWVGSEPLSSFMDDTVVGGDVPVTINDVSVSPCTDSTGPASIDAVYNNNGSTINGAASTFTFNTAVLGDCTIDGTIEAVSSIPQDDVDVVK